MAKKEVAVRKRQKIEAAHKSMMIVVCVCAIISSFAIVGSSQLFRIMVFKNKGIVARQRAVDNLRQNHKQFKALKKNINILKTKKALNLKEVKVAGEENQSPLRVISDALPTAANSVALGSSLNNVLFDVEGVIVKNPVIAMTQEETNSDFGSTTSGSNVVYDDVDSNPIFFSVELLGEAKNLELVLQRLERSIRPFYIDAIEFRSGQEGIHKINIRGRSFYERPIDKDSLISDRVIRSEK